MPICKGCARDLDTGGFHRHPKMKAGHLSYCKDCVCARTRQWRKNNIERIRASDRAIGRRPERIAAAKIYAQNNRDIVNRGQKAWADRNRDKRQAHMMASKIPKPDKCERCGEVTKLQRHHPDYSKPLEVICLCGPCHRAVHVEARGH